MILSYNQILFIEENVIMTNTKIQRMVDRVIIPQEEANRIAEDTIRIFAPIIKEDLGITIDFEIEVEDVHMIDLLSANYVSTGLTTLGINGNISVEIFTLPLRLSALSSRKRFVKSIITYLSHELMHVKQYQENGQEIFFSGASLQDKKLNIKNLVNYRNHPVEVEAYDYQKRFMNSHKRQINTILRTI